MGSNTVKKTNRKKIDGELYVNKDTGETLASELPNVSSVTQETDLVIMNSEEYVILDSRALEYIRRNFSPVDLGRIMQMTDMTYGEFNVLYRDRTPHTADSLMEDLNYSRNKFANFMKRLEKKSIIYYIVGYVDGKRSKKIMLNPNLARKRKTINKECLNSFHDIRKIEV